MSERKFPSRRFVIVSSVAAAGGLAIGWALYPYNTLGRARELAAADGETVLTHWVRIAPDDTVTVFVPHSDMGQGVQTALPMMLAEELDADWAHVRMEQAPADKAFANGPLVRGFLQGDRSIPQVLNGVADFAGRKLAEQMNMQITGGSTSVRFTGVEAMRKTGAAARQMLIKAAARAWNVPEGEITTEPSVLVHAASNRRARYGEMAAAAAAFEPSQEPPLKPRDQYRIVGRDTPRFDVPAKSTGEALYAGDVRPEGLLYGAVAQCPVIGGTLASVDPAPALAVRGVSKVIQLENAVVVVADNTWRARQGLAALQPQWNAGENGAIDSDAVRAAMEAAVVSGTDFDTDHKVGGDADAAIAGAATTIEATYHLPYLSHAQMEPMSAVAQLRDGKLTVWAAPQNALGARANTAKRGGVSFENTTMHSVPMGGAFGRRIQDDAIELAVEAAKQTDGRPIQIAWSREEDMTHGWYRQASVAHLKAGLDANGRVIAWAHNFADKHDPAEATHMTYAIPDRITRFKNGLNPLRWGAWRSVDNTLHGFTIECFMDELAHRAGQDPFEFRRAHLEGRHKAALERVAEMSNWGTAAPEGRARGIAIRESFGTIVAQVAEVSVDEQGRVRVHHIWSAADPGEVVNPATFRQQIAGGAIFGLTAALYGEITVKEGRVVQQNFPEYDMVRMADAPRQEVAIINSGAKAGGAGEPGTPPVAAAVANAVFALTGQRVRELPLRKFDLRNGVRRATA